MYKLIKERKGKRTYKSEATGTEITTHLLITDEGGKRWWAFDDLLQIPFIRKKASENLSRLYGVGLAPDDISDFVSSLKSILKSQVEDKYEKAYSQVLQLEELSKKTGDFEKQMLGLCAVYVLSDDEDVDVFSNSKTEEKMEYWALHPKLQSFFLSWLTDGMSRYGSLLQHNILDVSMMEK